MIPRCACLLLFVFSSLAIRSRCAADEPEKPDPDRFGQPLIRAWIPSTLVAQHQQFEEAIKREVNPGAEADKRPEIDSAEQSALTKREGILIYYDPEPHKPRVTTTHLLTSSQRHSIPGHPWLKPVRFMKVGSREAFQRELDKRTFLERSAYGWMTLQEREGGFYLKEKKADSITILHRHVPQRVIDISNTHSRSNFISYLNQTSRYWTYRDGYMFFGDFVEILTMEFPSPRTLEPKGTDADRDVFVQVDLNAVVPRQKRILWDIVRKELERSLQQYDDEGNAEYAFRKSVGDLQLNLIQAVTNELESIRLGIDFASEDKPAKAELEFVARPRVNLERYFGSSAIGTPALAAFVEEPAALTLATSWGLPERVVATLEKFLQVVDAKLDQQQGWTIDAILASQELAHDLLETIRGNHQLAVKLAQTEHGFTLYGGFRIRNAERVSKNLSIVLSGLTKRDGWGVMPSHDAAGRTYYSFRPSDLTQSVTNHRRRRFPAELHFIVVDDILWFSAGRQDSLDVLAQSLDRIEESMDQPMRSSVPLAMIDVSLDKLFPEQDLGETKGFDRVPPALVDTLDALIPRRGKTHQQLAWSFSEVSDVEFSSNANQIVVNVSKQAADERRRKTLQKKYELLAESSSGNDTPISSRVVRFDEHAYLEDLSLSLNTLDSHRLKMRKFLQPDQSRIRILFDADDKRVTAKATVGLGVIKHVYSRMLEFRNGLSHVEAIYFLDGASDQRGGVELRIRNSPK